MPKILEKINSISKKRNGKVNKEFFETSQGAELIDGDVFQRTKNYSFIIKYIISTFNYFSFEALETCLSKNLIFIIKMVWGDFWKFEVLDTF